MYYRDNSSRILSPEDGFNSFLLTGVQYACLHFLLIFLDFVRLLVLVGFGSVFILFVFPGFH